MALAGPATAEVPVLLRSVAGTATCETTQNGDNFAQAFPAGLPLTAIRRVSFPTVPGPAFVQFSDPLGGATFFGGNAESGQVSWYTANREIRPGGLETWWFSTCTPGTSFVLEWFSRPTVPATFEGVGSSTSPVSSLGFNAPGEGLYEADVATGQGAVAVNGRSIVSPQTVPLGRLEAGAQEVQIRGVSLAQASWRVTVRALPVAISNLRASGSTLRPGRPVRLSYSLSGDTRVSVMLLGAAGNLLRTLVPQRDESLGEHAVLFDGRFLDGRRLPDGRYTVRVVSDDYSLSQSSVDQLLTVDGTRPTVRLLGRRITRYQSVRFRLRDALSGLSTTRIRVEGRLARKRLTPGGVLVVLPPPRGWSAGTRAFTLSVKDRAGNERSARGSFVVR